MKRLNTYIVKRDAQDCDCDEVRSMIINATTSKAAMIIAANTSWMDWTFKEDEVTIHNVNKVYGVILTDSIIG